MPFPLGGSHVGPWLVVAGGLVLALASVAGAWLSRRHAARRELCLGSAAGALPGSGRRRVPGFVCSATGATSSSADSSSRLRLAGSSSSGVSAAPPTAITADRIKVPRPRDSAGTRRRTRR